MKWYHSVHLSIKFRLPPGHPPYLLTAHSAAVSNYRGNLLVRQGILRPSPTREKDFEERLRPPTKSLRINQSINQDGVDILMGSNYWYSSRGMQGWPTDLKIIILRSVGWPSYQTYCCIFFGENLWISGENRKTYSPFLPKMKKGIRFCQVWICLVEIQKNGRGISGVIAFFLPNSYAIFT